MIAVLERAEALARHAKYLGVRVNEFAVIATVAEGFEVLDYMAAGQYAGHIQFLTDLTLAKKHGDPWEMLTDFQFYGLEVLRADRLH